VNIPHPFPTPQDPYKNLAHVPPNLDAVIAPWRPARQLLRGAERAWEDLPPQKAAE
jgi:hypothetical protein